MSLISRLVEKLQRHPKRIVFPEGSDPRIIQAARQMVIRRVGVPILLGDRTLMKSVAARLDISLQGIRLLEPDRTDDFENMAIRLQALRKDKGLSPEEARETLRDNNYYATMMLASGQVDALVSGATATASSALRPLFQIIPRLEGVDTASSMLMLDLEERNFGMEGVLFMADCGVIPEPTTEQLSDIAISTAHLAHHLTGKTPRIAMLGFSSHSPVVKHSSIEKARQATARVREKAKAVSFELVVDGELQADAALDAFTAENKKVGGPVAGRANVLVFPDLTSGNIASKMVQIIAGASLYGQIITGLSRPAAEISRGVSAHDIFGTAVIVGAQAIDHELLYGSKATATAP